MFRNLLDHPLNLLIVLAIVLVVFGANKLPGVAKSVGQSLKIFKSEVKDLREDDPTRTTVVDPVAAPQTPPPAATPQGSTGDGRAPLA
ncbi:MAG: twin-arginine translocase TatA/TatE family subunit [Actinobacteria bacterium]|nr:twin-arginine translocase TatA/TatE family subunit [Actinomycetota bacterium]MCG2800954.1 twin-arginine translocase TatA/TatE family subunit [Cellulomonas sp.]